MRAFARLTFLYTVSFLFFLLAGTSVSVMREWLQAAQAIVPEPFPLIGSVFRALIKNVPLGAYGAALLVLPSAVHRGYGMFVTSVAVFLLTGAALFASVFSFTTLSGAAGERELPVRRLETDHALVRLDGVDVAFVGEIAVEAVPGEKSVLVPAEKAVRRIGASRRQPPLGSFADLPAPLVSLQNDLAGCADRLKAAFGLGWAELLAYSFALALLLASFSPLAGATRWPLADLVLCALAFRGVLILEAIISSGPALRFARSLGYPVPEHFIAPILLASAGLLTAAVGTLVRLARKGA